MFFGFVLKSVCKEQLNFKNMISQNLAEYMT